MRVGPSYRSIRTVIIAAMLTACLPACKKYNPYIYVKPEITLSPNDARLQERTIHFFSDTVYALTATLTRDSGQDLTIDAGTLLKMSDNISVIINPGATIHAKGTATQPIIFTSSASLGTAGVGSGGTGTLGLHSWRGIQIFSNQAASASPEGSGVMNYVRIEFAGSMGYFGGPYPYYGSLLLSNVGKNTSIEHIMVSYSFYNPSFEFLGGDVNARYLISYASSAADFNIHQGYKGMLQHLLGYRHPYFPGSNADFNGSLCGLYIEDDSTRPSISNLSIIGPDASQASPQYNNPNNGAAFLATNGAKFHIRNSIFMGFPKNGWYLANTAVAQSVANNTNDFRYCLLQCNDSARTFYLAPHTYLSYTSHEFRNYLLRPEFGNLLVVSTGDFLFTDPYNYDVRPNPLPKTDAMELSGANFDEAPFTDVFFQKVPYIGALNTEGWLKDWTNFIPLRTSYNIR